MPPKSSPGILARLRRREVDVGVADASYVGTSTDIQIQDLSAHQGRLIVRPGHPLRRKKNIQLADVMLNFGRLCPVLPSVR